MNQTHEETLRREFFEENFSIQEPFFSRSRSGSDIFGISGEASRVIFELEIIFNVKSVLTVFTWRFYNIL